MSLPLESLITRGKYRFWDIYHIAEIYMVLGETDKAESYYKDAVNMNSARETVRSISYRLQLLKSSPMPPKNIDQMIQIVQCRQL